MARRRCRGATAKPAPESELSELSEPELLVSLDADGVPGSYAPPLPESVEVDGFEVLYEGLELLYEELLPELLVPVPVSSLGGSCPPEPRRYPARYPSLELEDDDDELLCPRMDEITVAAKIMMPTMTVTNNDPQINPETIQMR